MKPSKTLAAKWLVISTGLLIFCFTGVSAFASDDWENEISCENLLHDVPHRYGMAWEEVKGASVASGRVLRRWNLRNKVTEFIRLSLRGAKGGYWELAIYSGSKQDRATVAKRYLRWSYNPQLWGIIDAEPDLFVGPRKLRELTRNMKDYPHLAKLINDQAAFAVLHPPIPSVRRLELAEPFADEMAFHKAQQKLSQIIDEIERRNLTSDNLQFVASKDGELFLWNPEALYRGSKSQLRESFAKAWKALQRLHP